MRSLFSCVQLFATPWVTACQAPLSMQFPRQDGVSCRFLLHGIDSASHALAGGFFTTEPRGKPYKS